MFCRHNRLTSKCPICSRELEEKLREQAPVRHVTVRKPGATSTPKRAASGSRSGGGRLVTRRLQRAADDGYRNPLVPGLRATADAERLAAALPISAFDRGLAVWGTPTEHVDLTVEPASGIAAALGLR